MQKWQSGDSSVGTSYYKKALKNFQQIVGDEEYFL